MLVVKTWGLESRKIHKAGRLTDSCDFNEALHYQHWDNSETSDSILAVDIKKHCTCIYKRPVFIALFQKKTALDILTARFSVCVGGSLWLSSHSFGAVFEIGDLNY